MTTIVIDCKNFSLYSGGIASFFKPILSQVISRFNNIKFILVAPCEFNTDFINNSKNWECVSVPYPKVGNSTLKILLYDMFIYPKALKDINADYLLSPYYDFLLPKNYRGRSIITVHDTCYWDLPHIYPAKLRWYYHILLKINLKRTFKLITVSESSLTSICEIFGEHLRSRASIVYNCFEPNLEKHECYFSTGSNTKKILYTGGYESRKNIDFMFEVLSNLRREVPVELYFTGNFEGSKELNSLVAKYNLSDVIKFTGLLTTEELSKHYSSCDLVLNLSLCEGFGRSNLEAVQYNKPLVCSDIPVFRELVEDYAIYCDPASVESALHAIKLAFKSKPSNDNFDFGRFSLSKNVNTIAKLMEKMLDEK
nr:putative glycosyltransferase [Vibrio metoecus]